MVEYKWLVLALVTLQLFNGFWMCDLPVPLYHPLKNYFNMEEDTFEFYYSMLYSGYSLVAMGVVFLIGRWCDKYTAAKVALVFSSLEVVGMFLNLIGVLSKNMVVMIIGRSVLGLGSKGLYVCMNAIIVKWFVGTNVAFALSSMQSVGLMGSVVNNFVSLALYYRFNESIVAPVLFGNVLAVIDVVCALMVWKLSITKGVKITDPVLAVEIDVKTQPSASILAVIKSFPKAFWIINLVSFFTYCVFPAFNNISQALLVNRHCGGLDCCLPSEDTCQIEQDAISRVSGLQGIPYTTFAILVPFVGILIDKFGQNIHVLSIGSILFGTAQGLLTTDMPPMFPLLLQGMGFTCFGASFWSTIPLIVHESTQGFAYSLSIWGGSIAMMVSPLIVASLTVNYNGYLGVELFFVLMASCALIASLVLSWIDRRENIGLNQRNMKNANRPQIFDEIEEHFPGVAFGDLINAARTERVLTL